MKENKLEFDNASISGVGWIWAISYSSQRKQPEFLEFHDYELHMWIEFERTAQPPESMDLSL